MASFLLINFEFWVSACNNCASNSKGYAGSGTTEAGRSANLVTLLTIYGSNKIRSKERFGRFLPARFLLKFHKGLLTCKINIQQTRENSSFLKSELHTTNTEGLFQQIVKRYSKL